MVLTKEQLEKADKLLDEINDKLSTVGGSDEEWNLFSDIQGAVNDAMEDVCAQLELIRNTDKINAA